MLINARFESSVSPPLTLTDSDLGLKVPGMATGGEGPPSNPVVPFLKRLILGIVRPKVVNRSDLGWLQKEWKPYGEPFPWQIGFALALLGVVYIGHLSFMLIRKAVK